jgi:AcrR family transcriptional regulator
MMDDVKPQREYHSTRREQQAQATREAIVAAARTLFVRDGYAATSVRAIAAEAGVSDQTIYAAFGSKRALLTALWNALDVNAGVMELRDRLQAAHGDPGRQLDLIIGFDMQLFERSADVIEAARRAGDAEPELSNIAVEGRERGRRGRETVMAAWERAGVLRADLTLKEAIDIFIALCNPDTYTYLTGESGWTAERYEVWLRGALRELLLVESAR